jgi:hypothetical protein
MVEAAGPAISRLLLVSEITNRNQRIRDENLVFHGLRKNAVNMLLEIGCTEAMVSAVVEMSEAMVRHYSRDVNKRRLAIAGMKKLEEGWKEARLNLFGGAQSPLIRNAHRT